MESRRLLATTSDIPDLLSDCLAGGGLILNEQNLSPSLLRPLNRHSGRIDAEGGELSRPAGVDRPLL